jgi:hypothetical protein
VRHPEDRGSIITGRSGSNGFESEGRRSTGDSPGSTHSGRFRRVLAMLVGNLCGPNRGQLIQGGSHGQAGSLLDTGQ